MSRPAKAESEQLADRIRGVLRAHREVTEKRMFGGVAFMVRLGEDGVADTLRPSHVKPMDFTGKVLKSKAYVRPAVIRTSEALAMGVKKAVALAGTLPLRKAAARTSRKKDS